MRCMILLGVALRSAMAIVAGLLLVLGPARVGSQLIPCGQGSDATRIGEALDRIRDSVDPCGESPELVRMLDALASCTTARYEICTTTNATRNLFGRPRGENGTITWNPDLRTELERVCADDPLQPVMRDPTASLVHEIVHAVHDCDGLVSGEDELEAVRIENIYRRAAGLCRRVRYGDEELPREAVKPCAAGVCACGAVAPEVNTVPLRTRYDAPGEAARQSADSAPGHDHSGTR
jgi:hypothetical protein